MLADRIAARIAHRGGHWQWTGPTSSGGTPEVWCGRRVLSVRRWCWERAHGDLAPGDTVIRTCDERRCVAPEHARLLDRTRPLLAAALRQRCGLTHRRIAQLLDVNVSIAHRWSRTELPNRAVLRGAADWQSHALCRGLPVAAFFDPAHEPAVVALCERCPVADSCLRATPSSTGARACGAGRCCRATATAGEH